MAKSTWSYDPRASRYRDDATGRFLTNKSMVTLRDRVVTTAQKDAVGLAQQAANGTITPETFKLGMRDLLRNVHGSEAAFGRGGVNAMAPKDWGRLGSTLRTEYGHLDKFAEKIASLTPERAAQRAGLYVDSAVKSYEKGRAASFDVILPDHPPLHGNCRCSWELVTTDAGIEATWFTQDDGNVCPACSAMRSQYNPLVIARPERQTESRPVRLRIVARRDAA